MRQGHLQLDKFVLYILLFKVTHNDGLSFSVRYLILDEADRLLDPEFLPQTQEVLAACTHANVRKAVFSATLPANAEKIAMGALKNPVRIVVGLK